MKKILRVGTRESQLAVWQAEQVKTLLYQAGHEAELVFIKSEGDIDLKTPLYEMGVQGIFTRSLDIALLNNRIDLAVHSMKDVPTQLPEGIRQAAVLKRGSYKDIFVPRPNLYDFDTPFGFNEVTIIGTPSKVISTVNLRIPLKEHPDRPGEPEDIVIATSSVRRLAQWLNKYPNHKIENLRGNVNTRLQKLKDSNWHGAIFAAAGLERIGLRPENSVELDWMLPAPAQGAIMVVCREDDHFSLNVCNNFNDPNTALATKIERDFLKVLLGGCSTPISALAEVRRKYVQLKGNILSLDGKEKADIGYTVDKSKADDLGKLAAEAILANKGKEIIEKIRNAGK